MNQSDYPSDWDSRRRDVYDRDGHMCQNCGNIGGSQGHAELHAHHIVPKSKGGSHSKSNLVTVCKQCHNAIHGDSYAPRKSMSFPGQKSDDIFGDLGILMNHWSEFSGQYGMLTLEDAIPSSLLDDLRAEAFQIKTIIAGLNVEDARPLATDAYIEDKYSLLNVVWTDVENTVSLIHLNNRIKLEAVAEKKISCPDCDASVSPDMSYCSSCGTEIPDWSNCIDCGENVDVSDDFCGNCGAELPEGGDLVNSKLETLIQEYEELVEDLNEQQIWIDRVMMRDVAHTAHIDEDSNTERVDWRYCPECGFRHSVYKPKGGRTSECILCEATWQESGINSNKWEMVSGEQQGEMKSGSDWEKMGQEKNKSKEFEQYSDFDTIRVAQRFGG